MEWNVVLLEEAQQDVDFLYRRERTVFIEAKRLMRDLKLNPFMGTECRDELAGVRKFRFGQGEYRLIWNPIEESQRVDVLAVAKKGRSSTFYEELRERYSRALEEGRTSSNDET